MITHDYYFLCKQYLVPIATKLLSHEIALMDIIDRSSIAKQLGSTTLRIFAARSWGCLVKYNNFVWTKTPNSVIIGYWVLFMTLSEE